VELRIVVPAEVVARIAEALVPVVVEHRIQQVAVAVDRSSVVVRRNLVLAAVRIVPVALRNQAADIQQAVEHNPAEVLHNRFAVVERQAAECSGHEELTP